MFNERYIPGMVSPKEYDWKTQFEQLAQDYSKNYSPFISLDTGKVLGLAQYADELEQENDRLKDLNREMVGGINQLINHIKHEHNLKSMDEIYCPHIKHLISVVKKRQKGGITEWANVGA